uniref:ER membrane protein complex subunit 7 beta-sandwich domain-containing protein n=1 Tax=Eutreptiella gymnastica TaxID=73025 RepID=A0A7S1J7N9_9EUGL|mmetsp:Transcript_72304/g.127417  ORF Transcript_72304/g.127417 Transcript_72304/m.127417 type:complete len:206 (+) Transcript_72304:77-694(+)
MRIATLLLLIVTALASDELVEVDLDYQNIEGRVLLPRDVIRNGARIILNGGERFAYVQNDGSFEMPMVPTGSHLLDFDVPNFVFNQVRIDMSKKKRGKIRATVSESGRIETVAYPLLMEPKSKATYFVPREEYNMSGILKNPMLLMMIFFGVMAFALPKMADPEEMKAQMKEMGMDNGQPPSLSGLWNQIKEEASAPPEGRRKRD